MEQREEFFFFRAGIPVDKMTHMVGSYAPKEDVHSYQTPIEDVRQKKVSGRYLLRFFQAPSGMLKRGTYTVQSLFTDDDKNEHLKWEWSIDIKKEWE